MNAKRVCLFDHELKYAEPDLAQPHHRIHSDLPARQACDLWQLTVVDGAQARLCSQRLTAIPTAFAVLMGNPWLFT